MNAGIRVSGLVAVLAAASIGTTLQAQQRDSAMHHASMAGRTPDSPAANAEGTALRTAMRKLWEEHVQWTRNYIISSVANLSDAPSVAERLLRNQTDIGNAIKPFYGDAAGDGLTRLLRGHITIATEVVTAAKANNNAQVQQASARWQANADSIADFLSAANPRNWPAQTLRQELRRHLELTTNETVARIRQNWAEDIRLYDQIHEQALGMADMLSDGIIRQFPDRLAAR